MTLAGDGPFTDFHNFIISKPNEPATESSSIGWIMIAVLMSLVVVVVAAAGFHYRIKIMYWMTRRRAPGDLIGIADAEQEMGTEQDHNIPMRLIHKRGRRLPLVLEENETAESNESSDNDT